MKTLACLRLKNEFGGEEELPLLSKNEDFCPSTSLSWYSTIYC